MQPYPAGTGYDGSDFGGRRAAESWPAQWPPADRWSAGRGGDGAGPDDWLTGYAEPADRQRTGSGPGDGLLPGDREPGYREAGEIGAGAAVAGAAGANLAGAAGAGEADEVVSGQLISIGLLSGNGRLALAGNAPELLGDQPDRTLREPGLLAEASRLALAWAAGRHLGRSAACGITIALTACAAAWFSAGSRTDLLRGVAALWIGYLVLKAGQKLPAVRAPAVRVGWLTALGSCLAECVVYAGLGLGAAAEHWGRAWPLAITVLGLAGVRNLMSACSALPGFGEQSDGPVRRLCAAALTMPLGGRVLLIGLVAPIWGARVALLALLGWAIVAIACGLAGRALPGVAGIDAERPDRQNSLLRLRDDGALARTLGALVRGNLLPLPPALLGLAAISALGSLGLRGLPVALMVAPAVVMLLAAPGSAHPHSGRLDWLVPAVLLGAQLLYLAAVGLSVGVPRPVIFALGVALLLRYADLAAPGRPVMLTRRRAPGGDGSERGTALGWEGRLLLAGLAAAMGIATFAYLALTVYFGFLIVARVVTTFVARQEGPVRDRLGAGGRRRPSATS